MSRPSSSELHEEGGVKMEKDREGIGERGGSLRGSDDGGIGGGGIGGGGGGGEKDKALFEGRRSTRSSPLETPEVIFEEGITDDPPDYMEKAGSPIEIGSRHTLRPTSLSGM